MSQNPNKLWKHTEHVESLISENLPTTIFINQIFHKCAPLKIFKDPILCNLEKIIGWAEVLGWAPNAI